LLRSAPSSSALSTSLRWCLRVRAKPSSAGGRSRVERSRDGADAAQGGQGLTRLSTRIVAQEAKVRSALKGLRKCTAPKPETRTSASLTRLPAPMPWPRSQAVHRRQRRCMASGRRDVHGEVGLRLCCVARQPCRRRRSWRCRCFAAQ
jgi:hypothetical protein